MTEDERFEWVRRRGGDEYAALLAAGYRECYCPNQRSTPFLLQRRIRDESGTTLYFINIWAYEWSEYRDWPGDPVTYDAEAQFNTRGDAETFNVELLHHATPERTEAFFDRIYRLMGCEPYGD